MSTDEVRRGPGRPAKLPEGAELSADDPRARAASRAAQLREHLGPDLGEGTDEFYIDPDLIPDGWSYEWKRATLLGQPDPSYEVTVAQRGWEPVPASRHPQLVPPGWKGDHILRKGMILMERPLEITQEVQRQDSRRAREQVRQKEVQLGAAPPGTFERDNKGTPMASIKKTYAAGTPIPD